MKLSSLFPLFHACTLGLSCYAANNKKEMNSASTAVTADTTSIDNVAGRFLTEDNGNDVFSRTFIAITKAEDFVTLFPNGGDTAAVFTAIQEAVIANKGPLEKVERNELLKQFPIQGSSTTQEGGIFCPSSVELVNTEGDELDIGNGDSLTFPVAGNRKLRFVPVKDPFYFFHGQCVATSGISEPDITAPFTNVSPTDFELPQAVITSHLCRLNLCLGGGGFNCIAIYSGTAFVFNISKGIALNNAVTSLSTTFPSAKTTPIKTTFEAPPLPPPFPGTIIGGTGTFEGIEGSVSIATIAGTSGRIIIEGPMPLSTGPINRDPVGNIVQVISVKSNMPLPPGP